MNYNAVFFATEYDEASMSIYNYFKERSSEFSPSILTKERLPFMENPEKEINFRDELLIFLSRHSSKAKINSITVHPVGNFSTNDLGGKEREVARSAPEVQTAILRKMKELYHGSKYEITFEATHHGPDSNNRIIFAEIGTERENWTDLEALDILFRGITEATPEHYDNFVAAGGGHYAPKFSSYIIDHNINVGHIISKFRMDEITEREIQMAVERTDHCKGFLVDKKGVKSKGMTMLKDISDRLSLELVII
jgi:D-aminoacyl-tRNA deacylase